MTNDDSGPGQGDSGRDDAAAPPREGPSDATARFTAARTKTSGLIIPS